MPIPPFTLSESRFRDDDGLFHGLLHNGMVGVYVIQHGKFRYVNPRLAELFGYTQQEISGHFSPLDLVTPFDQERVAQAMEQRLQHRAECAHYSFRGQTRQGQSVDVEVFGIRTTLDGAPAIVGMLVDVTGRCASERAVTEQLNFTAQVIEAIPSPLFFKDEAGRYVGCNKAFEQFIGRQRNELLGRSVFDISPPDLAERYHAADQALFDNPGIQTYEASVQSTDGLRRDVIFNKATYSRADGTLAGLVGIITDITDRKQSEALIWMQANYDALTGLPNRRLLNERLRESMRRSQRREDCVAVMFIDLDRFKEVNDTLGHEAGDKLLMEAARRIVACVRETDTVARQGGDEFMVLLPGLADRSAIERIASDIIQTLAQPFSLDADAAYVSASIGITLFPQDGDNPVTILKNADQAMYHAKEEGRNRYSYFSPAMQAQAQERLRLGKELRRALRNQELRLYYQPILQLASGHVTKAEALLRWAHPERGLIQPGDFIPIAEELGLIDSIGSWVFEEATAAALRWYQQDLPPIQLTINTSPRQFAKGQSLEFLLERLQHLPLDGARIGLEITENTLLDEHPAITAQLARLCAAGVQVSLDDFGTGYSAMAYLKRLDIDYLKIDRSFVRDLATDPSDLAITEAIIAMGHKLGLQVVAEGIETVEQRQLLLAAGCDLGQGYLFATPMPEAEFIAYLQAGG